MPKVALISTALDFRGGERQASILLNGLKERGWTTLVAAPRRSVLAEMLKHSGHETRLIASRSELSPFNFFSMRSLVADERPDIVHCNDAHSLGVAYWVTMLRNRPAIVAHRRMIWPVKSPVKYRKIPDAIIAISLSVKDSLIRSGIAENRIHVVNSTVDPFFLSFNMDQSEARILTGISPDPFMLLYAAALTPEKGHHLLFRAFEVLVKKHPSALLCLAGCGPLETELRTNAPANVVFLGSLSSNRLAAAYRAADVFVFAGGEEGLGTASIEAQAVGCPVVAVKCGGVVETILDGKTGLLVSSDANGIAEALVELASDKTRLVEMGANAREWVKEQFSPDTMIESTERLYNAILAKNTKLPSIRSDS